MPASHADAGCALLKRETIEFMTSLRGCRCQKRVEFGERRRAFHRPFYTDRTRAACARIFERGFHVHALRAATDVGRAEAIARAGWIEFLDLERRAMCLAVGIEETAALRAALHHHFLHAALEQFIDSPTLRCRARQQRDFVTTWQEDIGVIEDEVERIAHLR